jgi:membrane protein YqaA with SNARE-associated domain
MITETMISLARDSFLAHFVYPLKTEVLWHSLRSFAPEDMLLPTLIAFVFSTLAYLASYAVGHLTRRYGPPPPTESAAYKKTERIFSKYLCYFLLVAWVPFLPILAVILGFLRFSFWRVAALAAIGRILYYSLYLTG